MRPTRLLAAGVVAAVTSVLLPAAVALAGNTGSSRTESVTVVLTPPDRAGLHQLAAEHRLTVRARDAAVARLEPTTSQRDYVENTLTSLGLQVTRSSMWTVTA